MGIRADLEGSVGWVTEGASYGRGSRHRSSLIPLWVSRGAEWGDVSTHMGRGGDQSACGGNKGT